MPEFVSRNLRKVASVALAGAAYMALLSPAYGPKYEYEHVAKINDNFPVFDYAGPGVVAFMNPDNGEISMPTRERTPYGAREHVKLHETFHVYTELDKGHHDERGFNDLAVDVLRTKSGYNFFPFPSY